jgi:hypothetical protein
MATDALHREAPTHWPRWAAIPTWALAGALGLAAGCLAGWLLIGWVIWPVKYVGEAYTYELNDAEKMEYVAAVADSYAVTRQIDVVRRRLNAWTVEEKAGALAQLYAEDQAQGKAAEAQVVAGLTGELGRLEGWSPAAVDRATAEVRAQYTRQWAIDKAQYVFVFAAGLGLPAPVAAPSTPTPTPQAAPLAPAAPAGHAWLSTGLVVTLAVALCLMGLAAALALHPWWRHRTVAPARAPAKVAQAAPGEWRWTTRFACPEAGAATFDETFPIEGNGVRLGECGMGIARSGEAGQQSHPAAFEVWLYDTEDGRCATKVLVCDPAASQQFASKGEVLLAGPGTAFTLEAGALVAEATVVEALHGSSGFDRLAVSLAVRLKPADGVSALDV